MGESNPYLSDIRHRFRRSVWGTLSAPHSMGSQGWNGHSRMYAISGVDAPCNKHIVNLLLLVVSVTELASRPFNATSLGTRLRPKEYKTFPELTLNATLKDIHDFVQYAIVQAQKIVFGQDLNKTFAVCNPLLHSPILVDPELTTTVLLWLHSPLLVDQNCTCFLDDCDWPDIHLHRPSRLLPAGP